MSTLDDLRATLVAHAPAGDDALLDRAGSVRARVRVVRRRRRVSAVVGAVAAVALVAVGVTVPRLVVDRGDPGLAAATTVRVDGFEYRLVRVVKSRPGDDALTVTVPRDDADQAVALLADGLGDGSATLRPKYEATSDTDVWEGNPDDRIIADGANPAIPMPTHFDGSQPEMTFVLRVDGGTSQTRVGVAFYERTDRMPKGVVDPTGKTVFRQQVGSRRLLGAAFAEPGEAEATFTFDGRLDEVELGGFCSVSPLAYRGRRAPFINIAVDGDGPVSWDDCGAPAEDAGAGSYVLDDPSDGEHTMRVWTSEKASGPPQAYDGMVLGAAAYDDRDAVVVSGSRVDRVVELAGRSWKLDEDAIERSAKGSSSVSYSERTDDAVLLGYAAAGVTRIEGEVDGGMASQDGAVMSNGTGDGPVSSVGTLLLPRDKATYTVSWRAADQGAAVAILVYRPVD